MRFIIVERIVLVPNCKVLRISWKHIQYMRTHYYIVTMGADAQFMDYYDITTGVNNLIMDNRIVTKGVTKGPGRSCLVFGGY
jgi:hypothetical protein